MRTHQGDYTGANTPTQQESCTAPNIIYDFAPQRKSAIVLQENFYIG